MCVELNVPLAINKTVYPTTKLIFLGLVLDSEEMAIQIPVEKLEDLR
jgi:hypothetical protein